MMEGQGMRLSGAAKLVTKLVILLFLVAFFVAFLITFSGCWDRRELNELAITSGLGFDKQGNQYLVSAQIINPAEVATRRGPTGTNAPVRTYQTTGNTVSAALRKMTAQSPRAIYLSHLQLVVFGEEIAKDGIKKALDFLSRDRELRADFYLVVAKGARAQQVLSIFTPTVTIPAQKMFFSLATSEKTWAVTKHVTVDQFISSLVGEGKNNVLTGIQIAGDPKIGMTRENLERINTPTVLQYSGLAAFKKDKLVGWLSEEESKGYNFIQGNVKNTIVTVPCQKGGEIGVQIVRTQKKTKFEMTQGKPRIDIEIEADGNVEEVESALDLSTPQTFFKLERSVGQEIKSNIQAVIRKAQKEFDDDIFGFGETVYESNPQDWKKLRKNWEQEFKDLAINVKVDVNIKHSGTVGQTFLKEVKE